MLMHHYSLSIIKQLLIQDNIVDQFKISMLQRYLLDQNLIAPSLFLTKIIKTLDWLLCHLLINSL